MLLPSSLQVYYLLLSSSLASVQSSHLFNAKVALGTLIRWYDYTTGTWDTTGWWNSANCLTTIIDLAQIDPSVLPIAAEIISITFVQAPKSKYNYDFNRTRITTRSSGLVPNSDQSPLFPPSQPYPGFLNDFYDDEGWWAHAWIAAYDLTSNPIYLSTAEAIFADMVDGWTTLCGGGIWWDKKHTSVNAIANELFLSAAAHLANRVDETKKQKYYLEWAQQTWIWFRSSGMINVNDTINDGLDLTTCKNNDGIVWSYNQGVILGGLVELNRAAPDPVLISQAERIAEAAIAHLTDAKGVLHDVCEPNCGADGTQFKGVFMRNLQMLYSVAPSATYRWVAEKNAESIWKNDRGVGNELGVVWSGPFLEGANASTQSSALDALIAAAAIAVSRGLWWWSS